ncbi:MAG: hypothetical protein Q9160_008216 [Pyrenula sp. 1 TL-2023]
MAVSDSYVYAAAVVAGIASHSAFFRFGEHHLYGMRYVLITIAIFTGSLYAQSYVPQNFAISTISIPLLWACYFTGLYTSLVLSRIFFHPLRNFPGPLGCKVSSAWFATYLRRLDAFRQLDLLHRRYGDFLRIGSNDLSVTSPRAVQAIYGPGSKCRKAAWYDLTYPMVSLQSTRSKTLHNSRRRLWSAVFGDKHLRGYEKRMASYRALLVEAIKRSGERPMNMSHWFNLYTFDVMGDLAFGSSFHMLETSEQHEAIKLLNAGLAPLGLMFPIWLFRVVTAIPGMARDWWQFIAYTNMRAEQRMQTKVEVPDIMSSLLAPFNDRDLTGVDRALLEGDSQLIVVAGRLLAQFPHHIDIIRAELDGRPRTGLGDYLHTEIADLNHLNGVINEALRLYPPVPSALQRLTPPEGLEIDGTFVPGNVTIYCPQWVLGRNPNCYVKPNDFVPERWYSRPELIRDASGFAPFSAGSYGCIGRPLALLNVRTTIARIIAEYDVCLASGASPQEYDDGLMEHFTLAPPPLRLCFIGHKSNAKS